MDRVSSVGPTPPGENNENASDKGSAVAKRHAAGEPSGSPAGVQGLEPPAKRLAKGLGRRKNRVQPSHEQIVRAAELLDDAEALEIELKPAAVARHQFGTSPRIRSTSSSRRGSPG